MCGPNATLPIYPVKTLKVDAGTTLGFQVAQQGGTGADESENKGDVRTHHTYIMLKDKD
jgi:hypothetical protein